MLRKTLSSLGGLFDMNESWSPTVEIGDCPKLKFEAERPSLQLQPEHARVLSNGYELRYQNGVNRMKILRYLFAKLVWGEPLHLDEFLVLWDLWYKLDQQRLKDDQFFKRWGETLSRFNATLEELVSIEIFPVILDHASREELETFLGGSVYSYRAFVGLKSEVSSTWQLRVGNPLAYPKRLPPERRIGVGYKDKGTARNLAEDGTPSWQEVTMDRSSRTPLLEKNSPGEPDPSTMDLDPGP